MVLLLLQFYWGVQNEIFIFFINLFFFSFCMFWSLGWIFFQCKFLWCSEIYYYSCWFYYRIFLLYNYNDIYPQLYDFYHSHEHEYLFITQYGQPYLDNHVFNHGFWHDLLIDLGIKHRRLYNTRHTFATFMLTNGYTTPHKLAQILGHRDSQMVHEVYAKFINDGKFDFDLNINLYSNG